MDFEKEGVDIFTQLGLTTRQAEVYLTICKLGQATVKTIATTMQIARAEVYRATSGLQKFGLIIKIISTPTIFRAIPLNEGLSFLLQRNAEKYEDKCRQAIQFLRHIKIEKLIPEDVQYYLTSGVQAANRQHLEDLSKLQISTDGIFLWRGILFVIDSNVEAYRKALKKGVKIRYIADIPRDEKMPRCIETLKEIGCFEMKSAMIVPNAGLAILDKKKVNIITVPRGLRKKMEVLSSNNPTVLELAQEYFELKWQSAKTPC
jgi:sugar-specific transcriptional regulator TrmB